MSVLLIAEHNNKEVRSFTLNAITAASQIDTDVHVLLIGKDCGNVAKSLSEMSAVKKVLHAEADYYENYLAENFAPLVVKISENYTHIVSSANTFGKNLMPRIAAQITSFMSASVCPTIVLKAACTVPASTASCPIRRSRSSN